MQRRSYASVTLVKKSTKERITQNERHERVILQENEPYKNTTQREVAQQQPIPHTVVQTEKTSQVNTHEQREKTEKLSTEVVNGIQKTTETEMEEELW